jgi:hypothetical protein
MGVTNYTSIKIKIRNDEKALYNKIPISVAFVIANIIPWFSPTKNVYRNHK